MSIFDATIVVEKTDMVNSVPLRLVPPCASHLESVHSSKNGFQLEVSAPSGACCSCREAYFRSHDWVVFKSRTAAKLSPKVSPTTGSVPHETRPEMDLSGCF